MKNFQEACPLKVREYLAYGFPVIVGYKDSLVLDSDVDPDFIFSFDAPSGDMPWDDIKKFIEQNRNRIVDHAEIKMISLKTLEAARLSFLESLC